MSIPLTLALGALSIVIVAAITIGRSELEYRRTGRYRGVVTSALFGDAAANAPVQHCFIELRDDAVVATARGSRGLEPGTEITVPCERATAPGVESRMPSVWEVDTGHLGEADFIRIVAARRPRSSAG